MRQKKRPILYNGQALAKTIQKSSGFREKAKPLSFEEARENLLSGIANSRRLVANMTERDRLPNEFVLGLVMHPDFTAKSYYPTTIFDTQTKKFGLKEVGSRTFAKVGEPHIKSFDNRPTKMIFVRATSDSLNSFEKNLNRESSNLSNSFIRDIQKLSGVTLLSGVDQVMGFDEDWINGRVEAVFHPFDRDQERLLKHFRRESEQHVENAELRFTRYSSGISFASFLANRETIKSIMGYNPLRNVHPLQIRTFSNAIRSSRTAAAPPPPLFVERERIVVGLLDTGLRLDNPYLENYVTNSSEVRYPIPPPLLDHGTAVAGALLYGPLNNANLSAPLPDPEFTVRSFGILSNHPNSPDPDLHEAIDAIEKIVPSNPDIKVYNLSIGPKGPILDDDISRFTYSCDNLSDKYGVLFCIATGNDGEVENYNRIQAPADSINNLAVGAHGFESGEPIIAPYSSRGPGREGCKMKPDIAAFGGTNNEKFHLISDTPGRKTFDEGTSFSAPLVTRTAAKLITESEGVVDTIIARALMIHAASKGRNCHDYDFGHGPLPQNFDDIVSCDDKSYTLIYRGEVPSGKYLEYTIPWDNSIEDGTVELKWTLAILSDVNELASDDYASNSVGVTFYPHQDKYQFLSDTAKLIDGKKKKSAIVDVVDEPHVAQRLIDAGFKKSSFPVNHTATKQYRSESELKADLKWDSHDSRCVSKNASSLYRPAFHIHAMGRGDGSSSKVRFALVLSVKAPKAKTDVYSYVVNNYQNLIPLNLKSILEINVRL